ncbi:hypothetical protein GCM10007856_04250 [Azospirillum oryzae]|nr:hypothetical protein GCM10007856_04250 [Azospirillum oryzae]
MLALGFMALGTFLLRAVPLALVSRLTLAPSVDFWLRCAAEAVLSAFITLLLFWDDNARMPVLHLDHSLAGVAVVLVHLWRGSVLLSVLTGTLAYGLVAAALPA